MSRDRNLNVGHREGGKSPEKDVRVGECQRDGLSPYALAHVDFGSCVSSRLCPSHKRLIGAWKGGTAGHGHCLPAPSDSPVDVLEKGGGNSVSYLASEHLLSYRSNHLCFHT